MTSYQDQERRDRDAEDALERTKDKARDAAEATEQKARNLADRLHDTVEDAIPGDSDHDGH
jgi:hypothetical protein